MNKMSGMLSFFSVLGLFCGLFSGVSALGNEEILRAAEEGRTQDVKTLLRQSVNPIADLNYISHVDGICAGLLIERAQKWDQVLDISDLDFLQMKEVLKARTPQWNDRMRPREFRVAQLKLLASNLEIRVFFQKKNNELLEAKRLEVQKQIQQEIETFRLLLQEREGWLEDFRTLPGYDALLARGEGLNAEIIACVHRACKDDLLVGSSTEKRAIRAAVTKVLGKPVPKEKRRKPRAPGFVGSLNRDLLPAVREDEKVELENPASPKRVKEEPKAEDLQAEESVDEWFDTRLPLPDDQLAAFHSCGSIGEMLDQEYPVQELQFDEWNSPKKSHSENSVNPDRSPDFSYGEQSPSKFTSWNHSKHLF